MIVYGVFYLEQSSFTDLCNALRRLGLSLYSDLTTASHVHTLTLNIMLK